MSLAEFQRALADLIASPEACLRAREEPDVAFAEYLLTERERRRLTLMVRSDAMSVNCTLYRVNRLTPIYSVLPLTCSFLGAALGSELTKFWGSFDDATLQYKREAWRFGQWLLRRIATGEVIGGPIEDALRFELAAFEVRTAPRQAEGSWSTDHSRRRTIPFRFEPRLVLDPSGVREWEPLPEEAWVLLDASGASLELSVVKAASDMPATVVTTAPGSSIL